MENPFRLAWIVHYNRKVLDENSFLEPSVTTAVIGMTAGRRRPKPAGA
jgi:hypothetical protein